MEDETLDSQKLLESPCMYSTDELHDFEGDRLNALDPKKLVGTPPAVVGAFLERLDVDDRRIVLRKLTASEASDILAEMDAEESAEVVGAMREWRALKILEDLDPDDAADVLGELDSESRDQLISKLDPETTRKVIKLLSYDPDTAGGVMTPNVATVLADMTINTAIDHIRKIKDEIAHFIYVYVVDTQKRLLGVLSMRDLILAKPTQHVQEIMKTDLQGVCRAGDDKEAVANKMAELNFYALPVIGEEGHLLGMIEHDDVIDIIQSEATEDLQRMVGAGPDESIHDPISYSIKKRSPWLLVNLITALMGAAVINRFRGEIEILSILAVYMSIIASLGGNTGAQTLAVAIRSLAMGEIQSFDHWTICIREGLKGLMNGLIVGAAAAAIGYFATHNPMVALVVFSASILSMAIGGIAGAFIPLLLKKLNFDPAQSSSIFLTASTDIAGYFIFLSLGTWLLL
jgi:magnesium transporter